MSVTARMRKFAGPHKAGVAAFLVFIALFAAPESAISQSPLPEEPEKPALPPPRPKDDRGSLTFQFDNDVFSGTDRYFTHGTRASWLSREGGAPDFIRNLARKFPTFTAADRIRISYTIGQNIFTPSDTSLSDPPEDDRPYAGWTYFGVGLVGETAEWLDKIELDLGVVGPYSFAEDVQTGWHNLVGARVPEGWDTQLKNEPGAVLYFERTWRDMLKPESNRYVSFDEFAFDLSPHLGGALGNVFIYGAGGVTIRFGDDLPSDYGPPKIRPSLPGSDFFLPVDNIGWYVFGGFEARIVGRNIFIDGNTFRDSRNADRVPIVYEFQTGVAVTFRRVRLAYIQVFRTKEFEAQEGLFTFGSAAISIRF